jgi:hypothetical protein
MLNFKRKYSVQKVTHLNVNTCHSKRHCCRSQSYLGLYLNNVLLPILRTFTGCLQYVGHLCVAELPRVLLPFNDFAHLKKKHYDKTITWCTRCRAEITKDENVTSIGKYIGLESLPDCRQGQAV